MASQNRTGYIFLALFLGVTAISLIVGFTLRDVFTKSIATQLLISFAVFLVVGIAVFRHFRKKIHKSFLPLVDIVYSSCAVLGLIGVFTLDASIAKSHRRVYEAWADSAYAWAVEDFIEKKDHFQDNPSEAFGEYTGEEIFIWLDTAGSLLLKSYNRDAWTEFTACARGKFGENNPDINSLLESMERAVEYKDEAHALENRQNLGEMPKNVYVRVFVHCALAFALALRLVKAIVMYRKWYIE